MTLRLGLTADPEPVGLRQTAAQIIIHDVKLSAALLALSLTAPSARDSFDRSCGCSGSGSNQPHPAQAQAATVLLSALEKNDGAAVHSKLADSIQSSVSIEASRSDSIPIWPSVPAVW